MKRATVRALGGRGLLAATFATAGIVQASGWIVLSASPQDVRVGQPVEVLLRTFSTLLPGDKVVDLSSPRPPFPGHSDVWNVLYPWDDYPFDVVAQHEDGTEIPVKVVRDPVDSTLWRASLSLPKAGVWTIWVRNFDKQPGVTTVVKAEPAASAPSEAAPLLSVGPAAVFGVLAGLLGGLFVGRRWGRRAARV
jgi:hypothetical protein